ncbi:aminotransferase class V-fold PLP-dependent enzyme, partial [Staphylococcus aureus]
NIVPWQKLEKSKNATLKFIPMTADGELNIEDIKQTNNEKTKIDAIAHISNVLGTINDVKTIAEIAQQHGVIISVGGAQAAPNMK